MEVDFFLVVYFFGEVEDGDVLNENSIIVFRLIFLVDNVIYLVLYSPVNREINYRHQHRNESQQISCIYQILSVVLVKN